MQADSSKTKHREAGFIIKQRKGGSQGKGKIQMKAGRKEGTWNGNQEARGFCPRLQRQEEAGSKRKQGSVEAQEAAAEDVIGGSRGRM